MVSEALILDTILKWLIPTLCVAIVGLITAKIIKPLKKQNKALIEENKALIEENKSLI